VSLQRGDAANAAPKSKETAIRWASKGNFTEDLTYWVYFSVSLPRIGVFKAFAGKYRALVGCPARDFP